MRWRVRVADAYRAAGMPDEALAYENCSDPSQFFKLEMGMDMPSQAINVVVCSDNPAHLAKAICPSCQLRTCPDCAHRETARLLARYMPTFESYLEIPHKSGWKFRSVVFTCGVSLMAGDIQQQIEHLYAALRKVFEKALNLRNEGAVSISDVGLVIGHEFGPNGLKLHFHIIYYGPFLPQLLLSHLWQRFTGWYVVSISRIGKTERVKDVQDALAEVTKYTTKFWKRLKSGQIVFVDPAIVPILHKALHGTRRVRAWGLFYDIDDELEQACCPDCGSPLALLSRLEWDAWSQTGFKPDEFREAVRPSLLLHSIHGNKSPPDEIPRAAKQEVLL